MDTVAGLVDTLALAVHYDGRMETLEEWLGWFSDDELRRYPALAVVGCLGPRADRPAGRCRTLARSRRGGDLDDPALGRQRDDRALGRHATSAHDAERCRAGACRQPTMALNGLPPESDWVTVALLGRGVAHALLGTTECATDDLTAAVEKGLPPRRHRGCLPCTGAARAPRGHPKELGARRRDERPRRKRSSTKRASATTRSSALAHVATARVALHEARQKDARAALTRAHRLRPMLDHAIPWVTVEVGLELTRAHLALAEPGAARTILTETERVLEASGPQYGGLLVEDAHELPRPRRGDLWVDGGLGDEPDRRGAPAASVPRHPSDVPGDCEQAVYLAQHRQDRSSRLSTASSECHLAARRSSGLSRSGCWRARSTRRRPNLIPQG